MTLAESTWHDAVLLIGAFCAAIIAIITCIALVAKLPPVRWMWRRLVSEPAGGWLRSQIRAEVAEVAAELRPNGGATVRDLLDRIEGRFERGDARMEDIECALAEIRAWIRSHDPDLHVTVAGDLTIHDSDPDEMVDD